MLKTLSIWNFALIEHIQIEFNRGLNILTGETGAGKSILLGALGMVIGHRSNLDVIRSNADFMRVEAVFSIMNEQAIKDFLLKNNILIEDDTLIITRQILASGRNIIQINNCHTTLAILRQLGEMLVDIHGQHANQALLKPQKQLNLIDEYDNGAINRQKAVYAQIYYHWLELKEKLAKSKTNTQEMAQRLDMLNWQINEIQNAKLEVDEDTKLEEQIKVLANAEKISLLSQNAYNLLYEAFGWEKPIYAHVAMVLGEDGNKLSKRNGDASFMDLYNSGYLPEAIVNYLSLLGWSPTNNQELFTMDELIHNFDEHRISKSSSQYDVKKLRWFNAQYIKKMEDDQYLAWIKKYFTRDVSNKSSEWVDKLLLIYKDHLNYGEEINELTANFFIDSITLDDEEKEFLDSDPVTKDVIATFRKEVDSITDWNIDAINNAINNVKNTLGVKGKLLYMPIRIKASGFMHGPELADTIYLIGKDTVLERLK